MPSAAARPARSPSTSACRACRRARRAAHPPVVVWFVWCWGSKACAALGLTDGVARSATKRPEKLSGKACAREDARSAPTWMFVKCPMCRQCARRASFSGAERGKRAGWRGDVAPSWGLQSLIPFASRPTSDTPSVKPRHRRAWRLAKDQIVRLPASPWGAVSSFEG